MSLRARVITAAFALAAAGCADRHPENSAACGIANMAGATMVLEQLRSGTRFLGSAPAELHGVVPARIAGRGTRPAVVDTAAAGLLVQYRGEGFPARPGFGLALVEDSADTFKGILIYDLDPPRHLPLLGGITNSERTFPLYGLRVSWGAVSDPRCPLFGRVDTTVAR